MAVEGFVAEEAADAAVFIEERVLFADFDGDVAEGGEAEDGLAIGFREVFGEDEEVGIALVEGITDGVDAHGAEAIAADFLVELFDGVGGLLSFGLDESVDDVVDGVGVGELADDA